MEGRWGRRVYGRIQKGPKYTRFYLAVAVRNGLVIERQMVVANNDLDIQPRKYGWVLDQMVDELEKQYNSRNYIS